MGLRITHWRLPSFEEIPSLRAMGRVFIAAFLGAIVCFIWGALSWMVLDWHSSGLNSFAQEDQVAKTLITAAPEPGVYLFPNWMGTTRQKPTAESQAAEQ